MKRVWSSISIVTATYNSEKTLGKCLGLVRGQNYPQDKIEIVLGDGGSTDGTFSIAKKYKAIAISIPKEKQHAEYNRGVAYNNARNNLVLILDHDNFLPYKNWLRDMVRPFLENKDLVAATTLHYHYSKKYKLMDRYFALFGSSEPLPYFLRKADRMPWGNDTWRGYGEVEDKGKYLLIKFSKVPGEFPSIGTNGTLMRRRLVNRYFDNIPEHHYPIDVLFDVVRKSRYNEFAFVKNSLIHLTHSRGFVEFMRRRRWFVEHYHFQDFSKRRWSVVMPGDEFRVILYVIYSLSLVFPLLESFIGFIRIRDVAWFVHPLMCFGTTVIYGWVTIREGMKKWI